MQKKRIIATVAAGCVLFSVATAHPGAQLLTAGASEGRSATTPGISYEDISGVHLFKGSPSIGDYDEPALSGESDLHITIKYRINASSARALRTQGFYSGHSQRIRRHSFGY